MAVLVKARSPKSPHVGGLYCRAWWIGQCSCSVLNQDDPGLPSWRCTLVDRDSTWRAPLIGRCSQLVEGALDGAIEAVRDYDREWSP